MACVPPSVPFFGGRGCLGYADAALASFGSLGTWALPHTPWPHVLESPWKESFGLVVESQVTMSLKKKTRRRLPSA
eukprot:12886835-Prorocentrum_lima.AAC.1